MVGAPYRYRRCPSFRPSVTVTPAHLAVTISEFGAAVFHIASACAGLLVCQYTCSTCDRSFKRNKLVLLNLLICKFIVRRMLTNTKCYCLRNDRREFEPETHEITDLAHVVKPSLASWLSTSFGCDNLWPIFE